MISYNNSSQLLVYLLYVIVIWVVTWTCIYKVIGIYLGSISINNGILLNNIQLHFKTIHVNIVSFRFRLWGNSRRLIISGLNVTLKSPNSKASKKKTKKPKSELPDDLAFNIFPSNRLGRVIVKLILRVLPNIDVEFKSTSIKSQDRITSLDYIKLNSLSRYSNQCPNTIKFTFSFITDNFENYSELHESYQFPLLYVASIKLDFKLSVNLTDGEVKSLKLKAFSDDVRVLVFKLLKLYKDVIDTKLGSAKKDTVDTTNDNVDHKHKNLDRLTRIFRRIYSSIEDISILGESISILEIPFVTTKDNEYFSEYLHHEYPGTSLELILKSVNFSLLKLSKTSAGFHALFDSLEDNPVNCTNSVQLLKLNFARVSKNEQNLVTKRLVELLNIPNYSLNVKDNFLDRLSKGEGFKDCIGELFVTSSGPILDLDTEMISHVVYNIVLLKKYIAYKKVFGKFEHLLNFRYFDSDNATDADVTLGEIEPSTTPKSSTPLKDRLFKYLQEYYPRLDVKLIIEQPRFIIRHSNLVESRIEILNFSLSSANLQMLTTDDRDYDLKCQLLAPIVTYLEKHLHEVIKHPKFDLLSLKNITTKVEILKNLKVKAIVDFHSLGINLADLKVFFGFNTILNELINLVDYDLNNGSIAIFLREKILKYEAILLKTSHSQDYNEKSSRSFEDLLFNHLPDWLLEFRFLTDRVNIVLGSRSILIPSKNLFNTFGDSMDSDLFKTADGIEGLRCMKFELHELKMYLKNGNSAIPDESSSFKTQSLETLTSNSLPSSAYWSTNVGIQNLKVSSMTRFHDNGHYETLLDIPKVLVDVKSNAAGPSPNLLAAFNIESLDGEIDYCKLFTIISAVYLFKETIIEPLKSAKSKFKSPTKISNRSISKSSVLNDILDHITISCKVAKTDISIILHDNYRMKLDSYQTKIDLQKSVLTIYDKFFRVLTESPTLKHHWSRLGCIDDFSLRLDLRDIQNINASTTLVKLINPNQHVVYKVFDNISVSVKVLKHLVKSLKSDRIKDDSGDATVVHPSESSAKALPNIRFKTKRLVYNMEDDPFESELGMIYQLGRTEQRKRIELHSLFENQASILHDKGVVNLFDSDDNDSEDDNRVNLPERLADLEEIISNSWINKVKRYKNLLNEEVVKNKKFLFGNEAKLDSKFQKSIQPYSIHAPLLSVIMEDLDLKISKPTFDLEHLPQYLYDIGQGVPLDTVYSLNIPTHIRMKLKELRIHLRDYPVPLLFVPANGSSSVRMAGHLVIAEPLVTTKENIRKLSVDLVRGFRKCAYDNYYRLNIEKTLSSVKLFTDINVEFDTPYASRFVWGQSYQFGIQQVMLNLDQFSKPPIDPSSKLGFWDKLRLVMHGKFTIKCLQGPLEVAFKGSRDPYDLFGPSSGFVLSFKDDVLWTINEHDDSRQFCDVKSDKISWYIPNYLSSGMVSWIRDSSKFTYLPNAKKFITSCYAYYLDDENYQSSKGEPVNNSEKKVVSLSGGVNFKVGFVLQRDGEDGNKTEECKPHYDIKLFNPDFTKPDHDSYKGFRSDYINMSISLDANFSESYNSIHLSPGVFLQFFSWWKLFAGNMQLPVRKGKAFGELKKSTKFSQHLFTNRFKFNLKSLFISHIYRDEELEEEDFIQCCGLRGKMDDFVVDLHQRKEKRIAVNQQLSRNRRIMKMNFHIADVHIKGIDLRVISAKFDHNVYNYANSNAGDSKYKIFDGDTQWFDIEDYEEVFLPSLAKSRRNIEILPLLFSKRFSYLRDTEPDGRFKEVNLFDSNEDSVERLRDVFTAEIDILADRVAQLTLKSKQNGRAGIDNENITHRITKLTEEMQKLKLQQNNLTNRSRKLLIAESPSKFNNKFILMRMLLKWNNKNRNLLSKYIHNVQLSHALKEYLNFESISSIEDIIQKMDAGEDGATSMASNNRISRIRLDKTNAEDRRKHHNSLDRIANFDKILKSVASNETLTEDYLIEIISPQIQLQSEETPNSVIILTAPSIDAKIFSVYDKSKDRLLLNIDELENRYGVLVNNANLLVFEKNEVENLDSFLFDGDCYGTTSDKSWPPWLGIEICRDVTLAADADKHLILENSSVMLTLTQLKPLGTNSSRLDVDKKEPNANDPDGITSSSSSSLDLAEFFDSDDHLNDKLERKLSVDIPKVIITSTSDQYYALYSIVMDLLMYNEPSNKILTEKLERLKFSIDFEDLSSLHQKIESLHFQNKVFDIMSNNYNFRQEYLDNELLNDFLSLKSMKDEVTSQIFLLMQSILTGNLFHDNLKKQPKAEWVINADEIIMHMLDDDRSPILDVALARGKFRRIVNEDDSNTNRIEVAMMQGFNLLKNATFPSFLEPINHRTDSHENLITVDWSIYTNVGGIKLIENFEINSQPLNIRMDEVTGEKLMQYIFKSDLSNIDDSPLLNRDSNKENDDDDNIKMPDKDENEEIDLSGYFKEDKKNNAVGKVKFHDEEKDIEDGDQDGGDFAPSKKLSHRGSSYYLKQRSFTQSSSSEDEYQEHLGTMVARSKKYVSINNLKISPVSLLVSLKLKKGYKRLLNIEDFRFVLPQISIHKRIMSALEFTEVLKKVIIRAIMSHLGGLLKNKFKKKSKPARIFGMQLKPLEEYAHFTPVGELQSQSNS